MANGNESGSGERFSVSHIPGYLILGMGGFVIIAASIQYVADAVRRHGALPVCSILVAVIVCGLFAYRKGWLTWLAVCGLFAYRKGWLTWLAAARVLLGIVTVLYYGIGLGFAVSLLCVLRFTLQVAGDFLTAPLGLKPWHEPSWFWLVEVGFYGCGFIFLCAYHARCEWREWVRQDEALRAQCSQTHAPESLRQAEAAAASGHPIRDGKWLS